MANDFHLPVADHVSKREAARSLRHAATLPDALTNLGKGFIVPTLARFRGGERLSLEGYRAVLDNAREILAGTDPVVLEEDARGPTRTRPKGEQHEFRAVARIGDPGHGYYGLVGIRAYVNRKRVDFEYDFLGIDAMGHMLERTMQRDLAAWSGRFREVDAAMADAAGLGTVWRYACALGRLRTTRIAMPLGNGLMLGQLVPSAVSNLSVRVAVNRNGSNVSLMGKSPFHGPDHPDHPEMQQLSMHFSTAIGDGQMKLAQDGLRDALHRFRADNADLIARIGRSAIWRASELSEIDPFGALSPGIRRLAGELADLLDEPAIDDALNHGHTEREASNWWNEDPVPAMRP